MKVLVTGASGFLGAFVARALGRAGHDVTGVHRAETRFLRTLGGAVGVTLLRVDLARVEALPGPFDAVVHAAATSPAAGVDTARMVHDNVLATAALVSAAERWGARGFILCSSLSLYGTISQPVVDEATPIVDPDAYGATKHLCELMLADQRATLPGLALRLPGVLGPGAHRNWLSGVADRLLAGEPIRAYHLDGPFNNAAHAADIARLIGGAIHAGWSGYDAIVLGARGMVTVRAAIERLATGLHVAAHIDEGIAAKPTFTLSSERAIGQWGYDPPEIGTLIDRYAADVLAWRRGT
jgi:nucleoside-diphosphate-sugar epimerase